jgi:formylglycine-generating enzyme required for sulfatase activity
MPAPLELLAAMRKHWKPMAAYLSRPSIEHYFFHPHLTPDVQMDLFWQSIISATGSGEVLIHTPAAALGPIARVRAEGGAALGRGWGVALARVDDGDYASILVVTAAHLVEPVSGKERDIKVYFPFLQGFGVSARRMPIADRTLDLGLVAVDQFPARLLPRIFDVFWTACPDVQSGPVDVPLDVMGWRRERLRGTLSPGDSRGAIRVLGVESRPGFSGGAVVRNGVEIAGMLTRHTGGPDGAVGASIEAMLRLIPLGQRFRASPDCSADSLERRAAFAVTKAFLKKERPALPDSRLLTALFGGEQAARIRVGELPRFDRYELGRGETPVDLAGRCGVVNGQGRTPESDRFLEATAPRDAQGRPVIKPEDTVGCSLPLDGRGPTLIFLRDNIEIPACIVGSARRGSHGVPLVYWSGRFWDGTFLGRCHQLHVKRHEPAGWVRATARRMPWNHSVRDIPAGPFTMGPCEGIRFEVGKAPVPGFCDGKVPGPVDQSFVRHTAAYRISRFPVTVEEYAWCVADGRCTYKRPETELGQVRSNRDCNWGHAGRERHPMNCIDWQEAAQFCTVLGGQLPTETQWEKSARGTDGRSTPWKDPRFGSRALALDDTMEVGLMSELASPYGIEDIVTQLGEWTRSPMFDDADAYAKAFSNERVTRGRLDALSRDSSEKGYARLGFRCVFTAR